MNRNDAGDALLRLIRLYSLVLLALGGTVVLFVVLLVEAFT